MSVEGVAQLRADIAASAARTRSLRAAARKMGGCSGMLMLQRTDDAQQQRARYIALALLTGRECRNMDRGIVGMCHVSHRPTDVVTAKAAALVHEAARLTAPVHQVAVLVRHWAMNGDYAVGDLSLQAERLAHRMEAERLKCIATRSEEYIRHCHNSLAQARKRYHADCVARDAHDAKYPLTPATQASTVAAQLGVT